MERKNTNENIEKQTLVRASHIAQQGYRFPGTSLKHALKKVILVDNVWNKTSTGVTKDEETIDSCEAMHIKSDIQY